MRKIFIITMIFLGFASLAKAQQLTVESVALQVSRELQSQVQLTTRPLSVFNYFQIYPDSDLTQTQVDQAQDQKALHSHINSAVNSTWKQLGFSMPRQTYTSGDGNESSSISGFYAAFDPVETANYAGENSNWGLIEVDLPQGTRFLELGQLTEPASYIAEIFDFSDDLKSNLDAIGCEEDRSAILFISPPSAICARVATAALKILAVDAILYPFGDGNSAESFPLCPKRVSSALLFVGTSAVDRSTLKSYGAGSNKYPERDSDLSRLQGVFNLNFRDTSSNVEMVTKRTWTDIKPLSKARSLLWLKQNLFGCGPHPETLTVTTSHMTGTSIGSQ